MFTFYVFDNGLNGPDVPTWPEKIALVKRLGFAGIEYHYDPAHLPYVLELLDRHGLQMYGVYTVPFLETGLDRRLGEVIHHLKGRPTRIEMAIRSRKYKPSDPAGDATALEMLKKASDLCGDTGPVVSVYPHTGLWTEKCDDGVRLAKALGRKNVGTNFNLVHWSWVKKQPHDLVTTLKDALPYLKLVTIDGLKGRQIVPLDEGNYDVTGFMETVKRVGYRGLVGLQCWSIKGPSHVHLAKSMAKWRQIMKKLEA